MTLLVAALTLVLLAAVIAVIASPLQVGRASARPNSQRAELEAAREAKYREIRDAELDYRTGKLSEEDYEAVNATLRAEALEILNRMRQLEELEGRGHRPSK